MDKFELKGIWKGEYVYDDKFQPSIVKASIPFIIKIKSIDDFGLFEGVCQDDPTISQIDFPAEIFGSLNGSEMMFTKKYLKTMFYDRSYSLVKVDQPHPEIHYEAKIADSQKIFGKWKTERTFRKIEGKIVEFVAMNGIWWMMKV
jgi:hypothetical protein